MAETIKVKRDTADTLQSAAMVANPVKRFTKNVKHLGIRKSVNPVKK